MKVFVFNNDAPMVVDFNPDDDELEFLQRQVGGYIKSCKSTLRDGLFVQFPRLEFFCNEEEEFNSKLKIHPILGLKGPIVACRYNKNQELVSLSDGEIALLKLHFKE